MLPIFLIYEIRPTLVSTAVLTAIFKCPESPRRTVDNTSQIMVKMKSVK